MYEILKILNKMEKNHHFIKKYYNHQDDEQNIAKRNMAKLFMLKEGVDAVNRAVKNEN